MSQDNVIVSEVEQFADKPAHKKEITVDEAIKNIEAIPDEIHSKFTGRILSTIESVLPNTDSRLAPLKKTIARHISNTTLYAHRNILKNLNVIDGGNRNVYDLYKKKINAK